MGVFCVSSFFCLHYPDWVQWVLCLISVPYSMMLLLCLQSRCLLLWIERKRVNCWWMSFCVFFCIDPIDWVSWLLCLISMIRSMMLLLCFQSCCLLILREREQWIVDGCLLCLLSFVFTTQIEPRECCIWFQWFAQWCCTCVSNLVVCWWEKKRKSELLMDVFVCLLSFVFTPQIECSECGVWFQWFTQWRCTCVSNFVACWHDEKWKELLVDGCIVFVFFYIYPTDRVQWLLCWTTKIH